MPMGDSWPLGTFTLAMRTSKLRTDHRGIRGQAVGRPVFHLPQYLLASVTSGLYIWLSR